MQQATTMDTKVMMAMDIIKISNSSNNLHHTKIDISKQQVTVAEKLRKYQV